MLRAQFPELVSMVILQGRILPFPLGFEEQGESISTTNHHQHTQICTLYAECIYPICKLLVTALWIPIEAQTDSAYIHKKKPQQIG